MVWVPSHGIFKSARAPGVSHSGMLPTVPAVTEATAFDQGQSSVKITDVPSGVEVWQPMQRT